MSVSSQPALGRLDPSGEWLAGSLATVALVLTAASVPMAPAAVGGGGLVLALVLAVVAFIAGTTMVWTGPATQIYAPTLPFVVATALVLGPTAAALVGALAGIGGALAGPWPKTVTDAAIGALQGLAAGLVAHATAGAGVVTVCALTAVAASIVDGAGRSFVGWIRGNPAPASSLLPAVAPEAVIATLLAPLIVVAYRDRGLLAALIVIAVLVAVGAALYRGLQSYALTRHLLDEVEQHELSFAETVFNTLEAFDQATAGHSRAVAVYARDIAAHLGLSEVEQQQAYLSGLLHDVGKVGLPSSLLHKPGPLTLEERRMMQEHPALGERILQPVDAYKEIGRVVRHHHEHFDGEGYPDRLAGEEIPLLARIVAVAETYAAMTSTSPYHQAITSAEATAELDRVAGTQLDPEVVAAFGSLLAASTPEYRLSAPPPLDARGSSHAG